MRSTYFVKDFCNSSDSREVLGKSQGNNFPYFDGTHIILLLLLYADVCLSMLVLNIPNFSFIAFVVLSLTS